MQWATGPVLTSVKEEKQAIIPTTLNIAVKRGKLRIYTLPNPLRFSESLPLLEATANGLCYVLPRWRGCLHSFKKSEQNRF